MKPNHCPNCGHKLDETSIKEQSDGFMAWYNIFCGSCKAKIKIKLREIKTSDVSPA